MTIYLPDTNYKCFVVQDSNTIRAYESTPRQNSSSNYTDYFVNSHYMFKNGTQTWGTMSTIPTCSGATFTTNAFYRNDMPQILTMFFIILLVCFYFPYRVISRMFGRWLKW